MNTLSVFRINLFRAGICMLLAITAVSCAKQLTILPKDQIDAATVYSNVTDLDLGVLGVYADWREEYLIRIGSVLADECRIGKKNSGIGLSGSGQNIFRWAFTSNDEEVTDPWANAYLTINRVNLILASIDDVPVRNMTEQAQKNNLKGELLAIRAFQHFDLYRIYAYSGVYDPEALAVPYVTGTDIYSQPSRPQTGTFFKALKADLTSADSLFGAGTANSPITRMGPDALYALEARVALYTNDWESAIDRSTRVIGNVPLASATEFPAIWTDQSTAEVIFKLSRTNQSSMRPGDLWYNRPFGIYLFAPATALMNAYDKTKDIRYPNYFLTDSSLVAQGQLPDIISKYQGTTGAQNLNDLKIFRTAEMILIRAEAYARTGDPQDASKDLNTLRSQRIAGYEPVLYSSLPDLITAILLERYKELPFEGHRYFDLKRLGLPVVRHMADLPAGVTSTTLMPSAMYYDVPIPQTEVLANPAIRPNNPGW